MRIYFKELTFRTHKRRELVDITSEVERAVAESGVANGICLVFAPHATAAIIANEHEPGLMSDMLRKVEEEYPWDGRWEHNRIDDNAAAHLASAFIGSARVFPVKNGRIVRGTWQNIFLVELDGPRSYRRVIVEVLGE
ncbi:MAG: YjbQ family protein [Thermoprotei archaeon]|nr:MAG: YjbQ family protein [Thermoprotei archaeon]RLE97785.1 MAG: YjbQ family protein [Thermoprotei archaeon]